MIFKKKYKFDDIIKNMNYDIIHIFDKHNIKYYDMEVIETNISIVTAFYSVLKKSKKTDDEILKYILSYVNFLKNSSNLSEKELDEKKINIVSNKIYIEMELIRKLNTEQLFNSLAQIMIENSTDENYYKYSQLSVEIVYIIGSNIKLITK